MARALVLGDPSPAMELCTRVVSSRCIWPACCRGPWEQLQFSRQGLVGGWVVSLLCYCRWSGACASLFKAGGTLTVGQQN